MRPRHFLSALVLVSVLTACGSQAQDSHTTVVTKQPIPATPAPVEHALTLDAVNSVPGYLDFTLVKVQTASTIEPSLGGGLYYENSSAGETRALSKWMWLSTKPGRTIRPDMSYSTWPW